MSAGWLVNAIDILYEDDWPEQDQRDKKCFLWETYVLDQSGRIKLWLDWMGLDGMGWSSTKALPTTY